MVSFQLVVIIYFTYSWKLHLIHKVMILLLVKVRFHSVHGRRRAKAVSFPRHVYIDHCQSRWYRAGFCSLLRCHRFLRGETSTWAEKEDCRRKDIKQCYYLVGVPISHESYFLNPFTRLCEPSNSMLEMKSLGNCLSFRFHRWSSTNIVADVDKCAQNFRPVSPLHL